MASGAVLLNEGVGAGEGRTRSHAASSEKSGRGGNSRRKHQLQHWAVAAVASGIDQTRFPRSPGGEVPLACFADTLMNSNVLLPDGT